MNGVGVFCCQPAGVYLTLNWLVSPSLAAPWRAGRLLSGLTLKLLRLCFLDLQHPLAAVQSIMRPSGSFADG
jgi:hypothetical protein